MGLLLTVVVYVIALIISLLGIALAAFTLAVLRTEYRYKDIPTPKKKNLFFGDMKVFFGMKEHLGLNTGSILYSIGQQLGPIFWVRILWKAHFIANSSDVAKELLLNSCHKKPYYVYSNFQTLYGARFMGHGLVSEIDHEKWFHKRAIMNPAFRRKYLMGMMEQFNEGSEALCQKLATFADGNTEVSLLDELNNVTLDVIAKIAFSMNTEALTNPDCPFPASITKALHGMQTLFDKPWVQFDPRSSSRKIRDDARNAIRLVRETGREKVLERIAARRGGDYVPSDLLNLILDIAGDLEDKPDFQMENMLDEFVTLFVAGQETTSNLLAFTIIQLGRNPEVAKKLQAEVDEVLGQKPVIKYEDLAKLEYMMRVLKETLRLYPPVSGTNRTTAHPIKCNGITIPAGVDISVLSYVMCRMEEYFDDPLLFNPDRFKQSEDGTLPRHLYAYFPFSMGQRNCIGQQFALIEARVILAKLLQRFQFDLNQCQRFTILDELTAKPMDRCKTYITLRS